MQNNRAIGEKYENMAVEYLSSVGMYVIEKNFRCKTGEIDIIMRDTNDKYLVFVEVKYRKAATSGTSLEAITPAKMKTIMNTARFYMLKHGLPDNTDIRFDVVGIDGGEIIHIKNAFGA